MDPGGPAAGERRDGRALSEKRCSGASARPGPAASAGCSSGLPSAGGLPPQALLPPRPIPAGGRPPSPAARLGGPGRAPAQQLRTRPSLLRSRARPPLPRTGPVRAARRRPGRTGGCAPVRRGGPSPPPGGLASLRAAPGRPGGSGRRLDGGLPASGIVSIFCSCLSTFPVRLLQRPELTRMVSRLFSASRRCPRPRVRPPSETPSDPPRCSWGTERHRGLAGGTSVG